MMVVDTAASAAAGLASVIAARKSELRELTRRREELDGRISVLTEDIDRMSEVHTILLRNQEVLSETQKPKKTKQAKKEKAKKSTSLAKFGKVGEKLGSSDPDRVARVASAALDILGEDPTVTWKESDLTKAACKRINDNNSRRGLYLRVRLHLREAGAVKELDGNRVTGSKALRKKPTAPPKVPRTKKLTKIKVTPRETETSKESDPPLPAKVEYDDFIPTVAAPKPAATPKPLTKEVLDVTRGKRCLLIGGSGNRPDVVKVLERTFKFVSTEWVTQDRKGGTRKFTQYAKRIKSGSYDIVMLLVRFSSHRLTDHLHNTCKQLRDDGKLTLVYLPYGYGVNSIAQAVADQVIRSDARKVLH